MKLYQDIILYENEVLNKSMPFQIINNLQSYKMTLDLTLLIESFTSHALNIIDQLTSNKTLIPTFDLSTYSDMMYFRLNFPSINKFSKDYISFLNGNLLYYQDQILNVITAITVGELIALSILCIFEVRLWFKLKLYTEKVLQLTTGLHQEQAENWIERLRSVKEVLSESSQMRWKSINYASQQYEQSQIIRATNHNLQKNVEFRSKNLNDKKHNKGRNGNISNTQLTYRIYNMQLTERINYLILFLIWIVSTFYGIGVTILSVDQISQIKPTLNLNLQLLEFKLQFDSLIVQSEILKTDELVEKILIDKFDIKNLQFERKLVKKLIFFTFYQILDNFQVTYFNFQKITSQIYNELSSSPGLRSEQKNDLIAPFEISLCITIPTEIPFCSLSKHTDILQDYITSTFTDKYGLPWLCDDNYEYVSGGIINMVHEFSKTITMYFNEELTSNILVSSTKQLEDKVSFLNSTPHVTQFVLHFTDQGKLLQDIGYKLLNFNKQMLNSVMEQFSLYIYLSGALIVFILIIVNFFWMIYQNNKLGLIKLSLINIPYDNLLEVKTVSLLKNLEYI